MRAPLRLFFFLGDDRAIRVTVPSLRVNYQPPQCRVQLLRHGRAVCEKTIPFEFLSHLACLG
jgi:hypothetical protein